MIDPLMTLEETISLHWMHPMGGMKALASHWLRGSFQVLGRLFLILHLPVNSIYRSFL